jgi:internalin A
MHANVLMVFCLIRACSAKTFDLSNSGITYFPHSVSWVVSYMKLDHNLIRHVDYIKPYPYLAIFNLHDNLLTQFPNFTNITDTLTEIYLGKNWIRYIPLQLMDILTNLTILEMSNNQLTIIPDVPGPAHTLYRLDLASNDFSDFPGLSRLGRRLEDMNLANNSITEVRLGHLEQLPSLKSLDLSLNKLSSFPNLCLYAGNSVDVSLSSNPLICDRKMAYVKLAENQGILNRTDELTCVQPPHLQNTAWTDIAVSDLYDHFSGET